MKTRNRINHNLAARAGTAAIVVAGLIVAAFSWAQPEAPGGFQLSASLPGSADAYGDAMLVITTKNCAEPKNAEVTATVVEIVDGETVRREIKLRNIREGEYAVDRQWSDTATLIVANGSYEKYRTGLIIGLRADMEFEGQWVGRLNNGLPTKLFYRHAGDGDVQLAMAD